MPRMAGGDASASRDALARAVAAAKAAARPRVASVFAKSSDPRYAPRPEANYGERWEAREALATVAGAGPAAARLGLEHPEHDTCERAAHGETRTGDATTAGRLDDPRVASSGTTPTWVETVDGDSGVPYYFNPETRETSWDAPTDARLLKHRTPPRFEDAPSKDRAASPDETRASSGARENVATPSENTSENKRWWYLDDAGAWRGPYSAERLRSWRGALPALLPVVDRDPNDPCVDRESARSAARATTLARVLGDDGTMRVAAALGIAAHPRATAAQVERAVAALVAARVSSRDINRDDDVSDPHDPHDPRGVFPSRRYLLTENAAVRRAMASIPSAHADAILRGGFDPTEAARAVANTVFRAGTEPAQSATLNRVVGRLSARPNSTTARDGDGADRRAGTSPRDARMKGSRTKAGPRPGPAEVAAFKERKRRKRDAWLDT